MRNIFIVSWMVGTLIILCSQIVALVTPPATPGSQTAVLIGPTVVVFAALAANLLILWLLIRTGGKADAIFREKFNRLGVGVTGLLGSLLTILVTTIAVNLITHFSS